ncbi:DUF397 domain-containing protein [Actinomadura alba]|uniref:DUF397 domain-containing protein n=2 Tax=Actinomadura alba TaxID=406431 RepID=A0ABR7LYP4_9ACTN|nr:DUF397 domain-containing protein [Actinomadura alba]
MDQMDRMQFDNGMSASLLRGSTWLKSARSNPSGNCVEMAELPTGEIAMRNSRHPEGPALVYTRAEIEAFINGAKEGDFDDLIGGWAER